MKLDKHKKIIRLPRVSYLLFLIMMFHVPNSFSFEQLHAFRQSGSYG